MVDTRFSVSIYIMVSLAYRKNELTNSTELAKVLRTNPTFVRKIVSRLVEAKLVESHRGKGGGVKIARDPRQISLKDIYVASMDDKCLFSSPDKSAYKACKVSCSMATIFGSVFKGIETSIQDHLEKTSVGDLVKKIS